MHEIKTYLTFGSSFIGRVDNNPRFSAFLYSIGYFVGSGCNLFTYGKGICFFISGVLGLGCHLLLRTDHDDCLCVQDIQQSVTSSFTIVWQTITLKQVV